MQYTFTRRASAHDTSAGRISVATCPPSAWAAASARIASAATRRVVPDVWTHPDTVRAMAAMSDSSGASYRAW